MKTQINDYYIDLTSIAAIGPLHLDRSRGREFGEPGPGNKFMFVVYLKGSQTTLLLDAVPDVIDSYNLASDANDTIKAKAKAAYLAFVEAWKGAL